MTNGSFETGNYAGWIRSDLTLPFSPLTVRRSGFTTGFGFFSTAPTDGGFASVDGFDGNGPGNIRIAQDVVIPAGTATLTFDYRAGWDMLNFPGSTQARTLNVIVQPAGGGANLLSTNILTAAPLTINLDTGNRVASVNLNAFAGQSVRVIIDQFIPENFTGPGLIQVDNVRLAPESIPPFDFDGDGRADVSVWRPSDRVWYLLRSQAGFTATQFGLSSDRIVPADFDGDGRTDIAVYRDGTWFWLNSGSGNSFSALQFGLAGDIPQPADFTGDGRAELAVYRGGVWYTLNLANNGVGIVQFGLPSDRPVATDYDGDGRTDYAVYRDGTWFMQRSTAGFGVVQFGLASDIPVQADFDGDARTDQAVYRNGTWFILQSQAGFTAFQFGIATDLPTPADYDGDGRADAAVYRNGVWFRQRSQAGVDIINFGLAGDRPIPNAFVP